MKIVKQNNRTNGPRSLCALFEAKGESLFVGSFQTGLKIRFGVIGVNQFCSETIISLHIRCNNLYQEPEILWETAVALQFTQTGFVHNKPSSLKFSSEENTEFRRSFGESPPYIQNLLCVKLQETTFKSFRALKLLRHF